MQYIKRSILIVVCVMVILSSFFLPSYASYSEEEHQMMLDEGFTYDPYLNIYYIGEDFPMLEPPPSPFIMSNPNFPDFNPNDIPWETAPEYIKEILYNTPFISTTTTSYVDPWKIPFVLVITNGLTVRVIVGINLFLGTYIASSDNNTSTSFAPTGTYVFCRVLTGGTSPEVVTGVEYACCYEALYDVETMETTVDWHSLTPNATGNYFTRFTGTILSFDVAWDYYCYGGNNIGPGYASAAFPVTTDSFPRIYGVNNSEYGFAGNSFVYKPDYYTSAYFSSFVPSTYEEKQLDTQKGIWATLKEVPGQILEGVKGFLTNMLNYLLYFQPTKPEHVNPFADILTDVKIFFDNQIDDVGDFKNSLTSTLNNVVSYIESGSGIINTFLSAVPVLSAFVTFFVVFCIVRKVIGR